MKNLRIKQTPLEEAAYLAFGSEYELGQEDKVKVEKDCVNATLSIGHMHKMQKLLQDIIISLPEC